MLALSDKLDNIVEFLFDSQGLDKVELDKIGSLFTYFFHFFWFMHSHN